MDAGRAAARAVGSVEEVSRPWELPAIAVLVALAAVIVGPRPAVVPIVALAAVTPELVRVDAREHRLPNRIVLPCYAACGAGLVAAAASGGAPVVALVSGAATAAFYAVLSACGGMGMGDVKLGGVLGLSAGLLGMSAAVLAPLAGFVLGGAAAVVALRNGAGRIPFGPCLLGGYWIAVIVAGG